MISQHSFSIVADRWPTGCHGRLLLRVAAVCLHLAGTCAGAEETLEDILRPVVQPTMARALRNYRGQRRYREEHFPLDARGFVAFRSEVVGRLVAALGLDGWQVRGVHGELNALPGRFRDTLVKTMARGNIELEVHLIEIPETGDKVPAVVCVPPGDDRRAGVCVFSGHSRHGLRDLVIDRDSYQRGLALRLAEAGFVTVAVEKIDAGTLSTTFPEGNDERQLALHLLHWGSVTRAHQLMACLAATEILATHPRVDPGRIGAAGVSLGGWLSVQTALVSDRIRAVADFGMKGLHVDPDIGPEDFKGEFQLGGNADLCHILPGMLSLCDRNVLALAYCPRRLLAGHGRRDKVSERQAPLHYRALFERQYAALGKADQFQYHVHDGGDTMPHETVIAYFQRVLGPSSADGPAEPAAAGTAEGTATVYHAQGEMAGEVTATSVILQSRLTATASAIDGDVPGIGGEARFELSPDARLVDPIATDWITAVADGDFIVKTKVTGLVPDTRYFYRLVYGPDRNTTHHGPTCTFKTLAGPERFTPVSLAVVTGMNYSAFHFGRDPDGTGAYAGPDKRLGYPALESILRRRPDFFVGTGDNVYYDARDRNHPRAKSRAEMRRKWHRQFAQPRFVRLFAEVPTYWEKDDHDFRYNDCDTTGAAPPSSDLGIRVFRQQVPVVDPRDPAAVTYRTHRINRALQIWLVEGRDYRKRNAMPDGPEKTLWGKQQLDWLQRTLAESDATFKILISPTPLIGPDRATKRDNHTNPRGFRHEGRAFLDWLRANGFLDQHFYIVCGDRHWQYHARDASGVEEFCCGALVDANAISGLKPGDPGSTDPEGRVEQFYRQSEPSGGWLELSVWPEPGRKTAVAEFMLLDENGVVQYRTRRSAPLAEP